MKLRTCLLLLVGTFVLTGAASAQPGGCTQATASAERIALNWATSRDSLLELARERVGTARLDSASVIVLESAADDDLCQRLHRAVHVATEGKAQRGYFSFFRVGEHYYVVQTALQETGSVPPGHVRVRMGWSALFLIDGSFNLVTALAM